MKSKIILFVVFLSLTVGGIWLVVSNILSSDYDKFESTLVTEKQKVTELDESTLGGNEIFNTSYKHEEMLEIELSSQDIYKADSTGIIGVSEPFNNEFITRADVIKSINRIGKDIIAFEEIDKNFQNEFLTLRHVEMVEGVKEVNSSLKPALKEYAEKILNISQQEDGTQLNNLSSNSELNYSVDVNIAETEALLSGR